MGQRLKTFNPIKYIEHIAARRTITNAGNYSPDVEKEIDKRLGIESYSDSKKHKKTRTIHEELIEPEEEDIINIEFEKRAPTLIELLRLFASRNKQILGSSQSPKSYNKVQEKAPRVEIYALRYKKIKELGLDKKKAVQKGISRSVFDPI